MALLADIIAAAVIVAAATGCTADGNVHACMQQMPVSSGSSSFNRNVIAVQQQEASSNHAPLGSYC